MKGNLGNRLEKKELSREKVELVDGNLCELVGYEVKDYGFTEYVENIEISNGQFRRSRSMIPFKYLDADMTKFKWDVYGCDIALEKEKAESFITRFQEYQKCGKGLYIFSRTKGSGKTFLSCALANEVMERQDICVKFISVPELLEMTKKSYKDFAKEEDLERVKGADLLILDDIGTETKKEWVDTELFRMIDNRNNSRKVTIFTSNVEMDNLKLDDRIVDRIFETCIRIHLPEKPIRAMNADKENMKFMQKVLRTGT